jgi:hypothetical protein
MHGSHLPVSCACYRRTPQAHMAAVEQHLQSLQGALDAGAAASAALAARNTSLAAAAAAETAAAAAAVAESAKLSCAVSRLAAELAEARERLQAAKVSWCRCHGACCAKAALARGLLLAPRPACTSSLDRCGRMRLPARLQDELTSGQEEWGAQLTVYKQQVRCTRLPCTPCMCVSQQSGQRAHTHTHTHAHTHTHTHTRTHTPCATLGTL